MAVVRVPGRRRVRGREEGGAEAAVAKAVAVPVAITGFTGCDTPTIMDTGFSAGFTGMDTAASMGWAFADEVVLEVMVVVPGQFISAECAAA
jgi:hypothetical protein